MKKVKGIVFVLIGLFVVVTLFSLLMPAKVMTVKSVLIHADSTLILSEVADLKNWKRWHPVFANDSNNITISEPSDKPNSFATWNTNSKENRLLITNINESQVKFSLIRKSENDVVNIISVYSVRESNAVQVEWRVLTTLKWYPWEKFGGIFLDKITGPGYEMALNNLKELMENANQ